MANTGIYKNPIFLNSVTHRSVKIVPVSKFSFAKDLNSVIIVGQEFLESAKFFPVVFTRTQNQEIMPVAILGLRNSENLFVNQDGDWKEDTYIPAFFRRYPFILVSNANQDGSFSVCVDSQYDGFGKADGMPLFDEKGNTTDEFKRIIEFLRNYNMQYESTKDMIRLLNEFKLYKDVSANITLPAGEKLGFTGLLMVDETAMLNLEDEKILELFRKGYLAWIYAHLYSLSNFRTLMNAAGKSAKKGTKSSAAPAEKKEKKSKDS